MAEILTAIGTWSPFAQLLGCFATIIIAFLLFMFLEEVASAIFKIIASRK